MKFFNFHNIIGQNIPWN